MKVNTASTHENLFRLGPVPGHGAQISARALRKGCVQTGARARASRPGIKSERAKNKGEKKSVSEASQATAEN